MWGTSKTKKEEKIYLFANENQGSNTEIIKQKSIHILLIQFLQFEIICLSYVIAIILACYKIVQLRTMINVERLLSLY